MSATVSPCSFPLRLIHCFYCDRDDLFPGIIGEGCVRQINFSNQPSHLPMLITYYFLVENALEAQCLAEGNVGYEKRSCVDIICIQSHRTRKSQCQKCLRMDLK